jgi:hypothetical protein
VGAVESLAAGINGFQGHAQTNLATLRNLRGITSSKVSGDFVFLLAA